MLVARLTAAVLRRVAVGRQSRVAAVRAVAAAAAPIRLQSTAPAVASLAEFTRTSTFPTATIDTRWTVPVEISLIGQLPHATGTTLYSRVIDRQRSHSRFVDELREPSAKLGATRLDLADKTALYTFSVGQEGHPFHRHQGHRVVVAVSGSGGCDLRFSSATLEEVQRRSAAFAEHLRVIRVPADSLFTMRFDGRCWHQFVPTPCPTGVMTPFNPAFFAISVHTDETGGMLEERLRRMVERDEATIASLTELLPDACVKEVDVERAALAAPTTHLSLESSASSEALCRFVRGTAGALVLAGRQVTAPPLPATDAAVPATRLTGAGFVLQSAGSDKRSGAHFVVNELKPASPAAADSDDAVPSWLAAAMKDVLPDAGHSDAFALRLPGLSIVHDPSPAPDKEHPRAPKPCDYGLEAVLEGFLENPPVNVGRLQRLRNAIVRPMGLRTSPLGCPVSSLLGRSETNFLGRFPVHAVVRDAAAPRQRVGVVLGADDKHLRFRTVVAVDTDRQLMYMATKVQPLNPFGRFYMGSIDYAHRKFVAPNLMRWSAAFATAQLERMRPLA